MASSILAPCILTPGLLGEFRGGGDCSLLAGVATASAPQLAPRAGNGQIGGSLLTNTVAEYESQSSVFRKNAAFSSCKSVSSLVQTLGSFAQNLQHTGAKRRLQGTNQPNHHLNLPYEN